MSLHPCWLGPFTVDERESLALKLPFHNLQQPWIPLRPQLVTLSRALVVQLIADHELRLFASFFHSQARARAALPLEDMAKSVFTLNVRLRVIVV